MFPPLIWVLATKDRIYPKMISFFKPKKFDTIGNRTIYSYLGVNFFKKYLHLTDLFMFGFRKHKQFSSKRESLAKELERLSWQTRRDELIHIVFMVIIGIYVAVSHQAISTWQWFLIFLINLYANVYPIFVQRHNRTRYERLLTRRLTRVPLRATLGHKRSGASQ